MECFGSIVWCRSCVSRSESETSPPVGPDFEEYSKPRHSEICGGEFPRNSWIGNVTCRSESTLEKPSVQDINGSSPILRCFHHEELFQEWQTKDVFIRRTLRRRHFLLPKFYARSLVNISTFKDYHHLARTLSDSHLSRLKDVDKEQSLKELKKFASSYQAKKQRTDDINDTVRHGEASSFLGSARKVGKKLLSFWNCIYLPRRGSNDDQSYVTEDLVAPTIRYQVEVDLAVDERRGEVVISKLRDEEEDLQLECSLMPNEEESAVIYQVCSSDLLFPRVEGNESAITCFRPTCEKRSKRKKYPELPYAVEPHSEDSCKMSLVLNVSDQILEEPLPKVRRMASIPEIGNLDQDQLEIVNNPISFIDDDCQDSEHADFQANRMLVASRREFIHNMVHTVPDDSKLLEGENVDDSFYNISRTSQIDHTSDAFTIGNSWQPVFEDSGGGNGKLESFCKGSLIESENTDDCGEKFDTVTSYIEFSFNSASHSSETLEDTSKVICHENIPNEYDYMINANFVCDKENPVMDNRDLGTDALNIADMLSKTTNYSLVNSADAIECFTESIDSSVMPCDISNILRLPEDGFDSQMNECVTSKKKPVDLKLLFDQEVTLHDAICSDWSVIDTENMQTASQLVSLSGTDNVITSSPILSDSNLPQILSDSQPQIFVTPAGHSNLPQQLKIGTAIEESPNESWMERIPESTAETCRDTSPLILCTPLCSELRSISPKSPITVQEWIDALPLPSDHKDDDDEKEWGADFCVLGEYSDFEQQAKEPILEEVLISEKSGFVSNETEKKEVPDVQLFSTSTPSASTSQAVVPLTLQEIHIALNKEDNDSSWHKETNGRRSGLALLQERQTSFQSEISTASCLSHLTTVSSLESLLESRQADPVDILLNLGFGGSNQDEGISRIPERFWKPSQVPGNDINVFLKQEDNIFDLVDSSEWVLPGITPEVLRNSTSALVSPLVTSLLEMVKEQHQKVMVHKSAHSLKKFTKVAKGIGKKAVLMRHFTSVGECDTVMNGEARASVLSPENRRFLDLQEGQESDIPSRRIILGSDSFSIGHDGEIIEAETCSPLISEDEKCIHLTDNLKDSFTSQLSSIASLDSREEGMVEDLHWLQRSLQKQPPSSALKKKSVIRRPRRRSSTGSSWDMDHLIMEEESPDDLPEDIILENLITESDGSELLCKMFDSPTNDSQVTASTVLDSEVTEREVLDNASDDNLNLSTADDISRKQLTAGGKVSLWNHVNQPEGGSIGDQSLYYNEEFLKSRLGDLEKNFNTAMLAILEASRTQQSFQKLLFRKHIDTGEVDGRTDKSCISSQNKTASEEDLNYQKALHVTSKMQNAVEEVMNHVEHYLIDIAPTLHQSQPDILKTLGEMLWLSHNQIRLCGDLERMSSPNPSVSGTHSTTPTRYSPVSWIPLLCRSPEQPYQPSSPTSVDSFGNVPPTGRVLSSNSPERTLSTQTSHPLLGTLVESSLDGSTDIGQESSTFNAGKLNNATPSWLSEVVKEKSTQQIETVSGISCWMGQLNEKVDKHHQEMADVKEKLDLIMQHIISRDRHL